MTYTLPDFEMEIELTCRCCIGGIAFNLFLYENTHTKQITFGVALFFQQCLVFSNKVCDHKEGCLTCIYFHNTSQNSFNNFLYLVSLPEMFDQIHDYR